MVGTATVSTGTVKGMGLGDRITVSGIVQTVPRIVTTDEALDVASFRLRPHPDRRSAIGPPPGETPGAYLVTALGALSRAVASGVRRGDDVVVAGVLHLRPAGDDGAVVAELHAEAVGLDVRTRRRRARPVEREGGRAIPS